ncbi:HK97 family phage prohead protease [Rhodococcoides fascians]|uniref:HK97 family phage prohead protease n=1 Tax=Rhodococcoides fascians TaxID=1828 RepID=UPI0009B8EEDF|nr:HK97 family phage prohead protease [Rhodococcus fascians]
MSYHPSTQHLLDLFEHAHLPAHLQAVSAPLSVLAYQMANTVGSGAELTTGLRKLLEAKDCFVRQAVIDARSIETRTAAVDTEVEVRTAPIVGVDEQTRMITGIAVPWDTPATVRTSAGEYLEQFARGSIADGELVSVHVNHGGIKRGDLPIGALVSSRSTDPGQLVECRIANTARGDEVLELARDGVLKFFSVGFRPTEHEVRDGVVVRTKVALVEVSICENPVYKGAVIESVRSAATEQETEMTEEEIRALIEGHPEVAQLRTDNAEMVRRIGVLEAGGAQQQGRREWKTRSGGELLKAMLRGDADAVEEIREALQDIGMDRAETRAYEGQTLAENGLDRPVWLDKQLRLVNRRRPLTTLFSREPLPSEGSTFEYPVIESETGTVEVQAAEGDDLAFMQLKVGTAGGSIRTVGGYTSLSRQQIERNSVRFLDATMRYMDIQYAEAFELYVRGHLLALPTTAGDVSKRANLIALAGPKPDSAPEWISVVIDAKAMIEDESKGLLPDFIVMSRDVFKGIALIEDSTGRPIFDVSGDGQNTWGTMDLSSVELGGSISRLPFVVVPRLPANSFYVASREGITSMESSGAPFRLQDENIVNLTKDFSLYGYQGIYSEQPKGITKVTWTV